MVAGQIITTLGKKIALNRTFKATPDYLTPTVFKIGTGTTTPAIGDTDIEHKVPISGMETIDSCDATTGWTDNADNTVSVNTTTYKEGTGALNYTKDGTASANASSYKTTTSLNFTSKEIALWIYVKDATMYAKFAVSACLEIRFGSDSSNYYYWRKDKADLAAGWNYVHGLTSATATGTTGTPVITACDYTMVQFTADASGTTWSAGDLIVDYLQLVSTTDNYKAFVVGYPSLDETNLQVTIRGILLTTDANGHSLTEFGAFNLDATNKLYSHTVHTAISKTNTTQVIYIEKDKISQEE